MSKREEQLIKAYDHLNYELMVERDNLRDEIRQLRLFSDEIIGMAQHCIDWHTPRAMKVGTPALSLSVSKRIMRLAKDFKVMNND